MTGRRPALIIQVDVDGLWAVRQCYSRPEKNTFIDDPVWTEGISGISEIFTSTGIPAAFFIVGRDLELTSKQEAAAALWYAGFEPGNHSYSHTIGMTAMPVGQMVDEIRRTDLAIRATGGSPVGFRAPGYDVDARVLMAVRRCGYRYDASVLPTRWSPALRMISRAIALRWNTPPRQFGRMPLAEAPRVPYLPDPHRMRRAAKDFETARLMEFPVGLTPRLGLPLTGSSLLQASRASVRRTLESVALGGRPTLLLFHGIDGVDCRAPIVFDSYRPSIGGFSMPAAKKLKQLRMIMEEAARFFTPTTAPEYMAKVLGS